MSFMAKMVKSFFQGQAWKSGDTRVVAHRDHRVNVNRKKRTRLGSAPKPFKRNGKKSQIFMQQRKEEIRKYKYLKWRQENPDRPRAENPFRIQSTPFKNFEMRDALIAAGVIQAAFHATHHV